VRAVRRQRSGSDLADHDQNGEHRHRADDRMKFRIAASAPRPAGLGMPGDPQIRPVMTPTATLIMVTIKR
jgi:hypothetical protein